MADILTPSTGAPSVTGSSSSSPIYVGEWVINLLQSVPELKAIYDKVRDPKTGKFLYNSDAINDMIIDTQWYRDNGPTVASRIAQKFKTGDVAYNAEIQNFKNSISQIATNIGLNTNDPTVSTYLSGLAETAYLHNWDQANIENQILANKTMVGSIQGGVYAASVSSIAGYANSMGIKLNATDQANYQQRLLGTVDKNGIRVKSSADDIKAEIRAKSASLFPIFKDQINAGSTLWDLTGAYRQKMADVLELDANAISWDDPLWKDGKIFTAVDPKTGVVTQRPLYDVEKLLRADDRWQYTKNATNEYSKWTYGILQKFGMAG